MPAIIYPSTLPGPQLAPFDPAERRDLTDGYGPREAHAFQRDILGTQRVQFKFTPAQAQIFVAWVETDLVFGGCWFASSWRLPQGGTGVRRFIMETQQWDLLATGHWLVSIDCEVRGRGEAPQATEDPYATCVNETFSSFLSNYSTLSGSFAAYSNFSTGAYGRGLNMAIGGPNDSAIERTFSPKTVMSMSFKFRLTSLNSDDAGTINLYASGAQAMSFDPRRELVFSGGIGHPIGSVGISVSSNSIGILALAANVWYEGSFTCSLTTPLVVTRLSDSVIIASQDFGNLVAGIPGVNALRFRIDEGGATMSETQYADIHIC